MLTGGIENVKRSTWKGGGNEDVTALDSILFYYKETDGARIRRRKGGERRGEEMTIKGNQESKRARPRLRLVRPNLRVVYRIY